MTLPFVTYTDLSHVHRILCIPTPLNQLSPVIVMMLTRMACQWKNKTPAMPDADVQQLTTTSHQWDD